jgi:glycogen operon protein
MAASRRTQPGKTAPLGSTVNRDGANFSVFSKSSSHLELLLFERADDEKPSTVIPLDRMSNRTYHYWHVFVPGIQAGQVYGYRAFGPYNPDRGLRFNPDKVLIDPYAKAMAVPKCYSRLAASAAGNNCATAMKSVVCDDGAYDWEGDVPLKRPFAQTVIYEMHVGGFTRHPTAGLPPETRGTYRGLIHKIPYLKDLGVTAVELLPVFQFDEQDAPDGLVNYWGYSPLSFFVPHHAYSSRKDHQGPMDEFRDMVKALHRAGIEVILDVVFNHTAEGDHTGPTLCYRGLENAAYYLLQEDRSRYADFTGTGNTLNANQPIVRRLIVDALHYWVKTMHVDGFRFDLASILSRGEDGRPLANPPILWDIESDPVLAGTKLIAEAWDAAGLYQVGSFIGDNWKEWNGQFRDDVRSFMKADRGTVTRLARRLLGSPDIYGHQEREPEKSINFVTCHDGFTLNDLVSYDRKHNEANGEDNRDGSENNLSWNCGVEGPTDNPDVERLRTRHVKNFLALTLLSVGAAMVLMGDEVRRTQRGNNNAYCQDNEISWFDWTGLEKHAEIHRFTRLLLRLRSTRDLTRKEGDLTLNEILGHARISWHGVKLNQPDWSEESHCLALTFNSLEGRFLVHVILNAYWESLTFELPPIEGSSHEGWHRAIDTALAPPDDISEGPEEAPQVPDRNYLTQPRSVVLLFALRSMEEL